MKVELLWFDGCPNHEAARRAVAQVLASRGLDSALVESISVDATSAAQVKFPGSPTIRVDGRDIEPDFRDSGTYALSCRVYPTSKGLRGQPEVAWIEQAIDDALAEPSVEHDMRNEVRVQRWRRTDERGRASMTQKTVARRGALAGSLAALATGIVCLACVLPVIGGIVGVSILVTAAGGIAEDGTLVVIGVATLAIGLALGAFVLIVGRRNEAACLTEDLGRPAEPEA